MTNDDAAIERLVEAARAGDAEAFGQLFDRYHGPVYRFVASRVARPADAEDLTQLVFVKALEALPRYEARGAPFGGWLFRLARNTVIDHVRTRRDHADLDAVAERPGEDAGPHDIVAMREALDEVAEALADHPKITVRIEGHTDSRGSNKFNMKLSDDRAKSVRDYLIGKGIDGARMDARGYGEDVPIADNRSDAGRAQNRRVEFVITSQ